MSDFDVKGADDFLKLSKALKEAGQGQMRKELHKRLRKAARDTMPVAEKRLREAMPSGMKKRGGSRQTVRVRTGKDPGISIAVPYGARGKTKLSASNAQRVNSSGEFRHPTYADGKKERKEWRWVNQAVPSGKGWFDDTYMNAAPQIMAEIEKAIESVVDDIVKGAK